MEKIGKNSKKALLVIAGFLMFSMFSVPGFIAFGPMAVAQSTVPKCEEGQRGTRDAPCDPGEIKPGAEPPAGNIIDDYVNPLIKLFTAVIGVVLVLSIVIAGIQYSSAGGDPSGVAAAKKRITAAVIALVAYTFLLGFLQWLVPGGLV